jgi:PadR family transcriptional regulator PadR
MSETLRAAMDPMILALLDQQPDHGYSLMMRIRTTTGADVSDGSLYPALRRLEESGRIEGSWEPSPAGRKRKVYHVTSAGRKMLHKARAEWPALVRALNSLLTPSPEA